MQHLIQKITNEAIIAVDSTVINIYTPFHLLQCIRLKDELDLDRPSTTVLYVKNYLDISHLEEVLPQARFVEILDANFNIRNLRRSPLSYLRSCRKKIVDLKKAILQVIASRTADSTIRVIVCNDKDISSQLLISACNKKFSKIQVVAVDEGTAYYVNERKFSWLQRYFYRWFSGMVLGDKIEHVDRFGTHSKVSIVYLRNINLLKTQKKGVTYLEIPKMNITNTESIINHHSKKTALFLTGCLVESKLISELKYNKTLDTIVHELLRQDYAIYVKQHPREVNSHLQQCSFAQKINFLDRKSTAEKLSFNDFDRIINFGTSVILDAIDRNYKPKHIITVDILNNKRLKNFISQTTVIQGNNLQNQLKQALMEK